MNEPPEVFAVLLVPENGTVPVERRLARVLKYARRVQGLRCVGQPVPDKLPAGVTVVVLADEKEKDL